LKSDGNSITKESLGKIGLDGKIENEYKAYLCTYKFVALA
jgi:hypothetical protein